MKKFEPAVLVFAMVFPTLLTAVYFVLLAGEAGTVQKTAFGTGKIIQFLLPAVWTVVFCRCRLNADRPLRKTHLVIPFMFGFVVYLAMVIVYQIYLATSGGVLAPDSSAVQQIKARIQGFGINSIGVYCLLGLFYSAIHSGLEEYYWRWFVFKRLASGGYLNAVPATVVSSLAFMSHHVIIMGTYFGYASPVCWLGSLGVAVGGIVWCWMYQKSGSLLGAWLSHGIIDAAIFTLGAFIAFR